MPIRRSAAVVATLALAAAATEAALGAAPAGAAAAHVPCSTAGLITATVSVANSGGTLTLAAGCHYTVSVRDNTTDGGTGLPVITGAVTVNGNGATIERSAAAGTGPFRLLDVAHGGSLTVNNVTLRNGLAPVATTPQVGWGGGAINSHGTLHVSGVTFTGNSAPSHSGTSGGAIDSAGPLTVEGSTFTANRAQEGGAIFAQDTTAISGTTFDGNVATDYGGGAIVSAAGTTTISASTFVGNVAVDTGTPPNGYTLGGGAIDNDAIVDIRNSTFFHNSGGTNGGGAIQNFGTASITSSTLAGNTSSVSGSDIHTYADPAAPVPVVTTVTHSILNSRGTNCGGNTSVVDGGYNIDAGHSCGLSAAKHSASDTDAKLGALADNGGPTRTMALQSGSAAVDAIPASAGACTGTQDQRGTSRPQGAGCDVGAYEVVVIPPPATTQTVAQLALSGTEITVSGTVTDDTGNPQPGVQVSLQKRAYNAHWAEEANLTTDTSGSYSYTEPAPTTRTVYQARTVADQAHTASASQVLVQKAPTALSLGVLRGHPDRFTASMTYLGDGAAAAHRRVQIFYHYAPKKRWLLLATRWTNLHGKVHFRMQPGRRCGFIVRFAGNWRELPSSSQVVSVPS